MAGGISQRKLAEKYGVARSTLQARAEQEGWGSERKMAMAKAVSKSVQKTADISAENAVTAKRIQQKLLARLEKEIDALPDQIGTNLHDMMSDYEYKSTPDGSAMVPTKIKQTGLDYKLKDLTAAWKDLMSDMPKAGETDDDPMMALFEGINEQVNEHINRQVNGQIKQVTAGN